MKNRRTFLKTACRPIVLAAFGIPILEACTSEDEDSELSNPNNSSSASSSNEPLVVNISTYPFDPLKEVGGWLNYTAKNILLVRISTSEVRVFDNRCPHQGNRDQWSYDGTNFKCGYHNNTFSDSCSGALSCYDSKLEGDILTITF